MIPFTYIGGLSDQVLILRLLRSILPSWVEGENLATQKMLVDHLFGLLGQVLVLCSSPFSDLITREGKKRKKLKLHAFLTASTSSTIAEEIVVLLRRLHPLPAWNSIINGFIQTNLQSLPQLVALSEEMHAEKTANRTKEQQVQYYMYMYACVPLAQDS